MVEEVEDVVEPAAPPTPIKAPLGKGWDRVAIAMVEVEGELVLLVDPHLLIAGPAARRPRERIRSPALSPCLLLAANHAETGAILERMT